MKLVVVSICSIFLNLALACPELNNVDLASQYDADEYTEISSRNIEMISKEDFLKYPAFSDFEYEYCKDALVIKQVQATQTGTIYTLVMTYEDHCDGGSSYGNILDESGKVVLGHIGDSFISCK